ncbi:MAG TPA: WD40 repeat domain-containing protein [Thermoguttaceae bacterium]|nr:WD40 repeat domain-containing protein [Thermoguttaceae bacterium]
MNINHAFATAALLGLSIGASLGLQADEIVAAKQSRTISIPIAPGGSQPAPSVQCRVSQGPAVPISAVAFSSDGKTLAVGGYKEVLIWDLDGAKLAKRIGTEHLGNFVRDLVFTKDGKSLIVAEGTPHGAGAVKILDLESGNPTVSFDEPKDVVYRLALSPDGKLLAGGGVEGVVRVWNLNEKKVVATINDHGDWILDVSFSADGKLLMTGGEDRTWRVWNVEDFSAVGNMVQNEPVHGLAANPDGSRYAIAVGGPTEKIVELRYKTDLQQTRKPRAYRTLYTDAGMPLDVLWTPDNKQVCIPCSDNKVRIFDPNNGRLLATLAGHDDWVYGFALSPDGTKFASGSGDGTVKLWNATDGKLLATLVQLTPRTDEWLITTEQGYLTISSSGALSWNAENTDTPVEEIAALFEKPDMVRDAIAGKKVPPVTLK